MTANATKTQLFLCARESEVSARVTKRNSKKMETFAFNNFFLPLFLSLRVNFFAGPCCDCHQLSQLDFFFTFSVLRQLLRAIATIHFIPFSFGTSDDICKFRFRLSYFLLCAIKKLCVRESSAIWWKIATTYCVWMSECCEIFWQTIAMYSVCAAALVCQCQTSTLFFYFISTQLRLCVWNYSFLSSKKSELSANERTIRV